MTSFELTIIGLLRFAILTAGCTYYVTQSFIFAPVRKIVSAYAQRIRAYRVLYFMYCPACVGTWVGFVLGGLGIWPLDTLFFPAWIEAAIAGCVINRLMPSDDVATAELGDSNVEKEEGENE